MNYITAQTLTRHQFKRRFGVERSTFDQMVEALNDRRPKHPSPGRPPCLPIAAQVLVTLEYWREYRTYFHLATDCGVSEATVCRVVRRVEDGLMRSGRFRLPGKKSLLRGFGRPEVVVMDVTETPIERPKRRQQQFYSGKQKQHPLKCQIVIDQLSGQIICTSFGRGRQHDFNLFKASGVHVHPDSLSIQDSGYQGIAHCQANSYVPSKRPPQGQLTALEKAYNRALEQERIGVEHVNVNARLKVFKLLAQRYRNRRRRYGLRCNLLAALYNHELPLAA
jgi:hypothetical protein